MRLSFNKAVVGLLCLMLFLLPVTTVKSHFLLNLNVRIFHMEHTTQGLTAYMRLPMPYVVANLLGPVDGTELPKPAPYTSNRLEDGKLVHYVDFEQITAAPTGLGEIIEAGTEIRINGQRLRATVGEIRVYQNGRQGKFATLDEARSGFDTPADYSLNSSAVYVGDATVDVVLHYASEQPVYDYSVASSLNPGLPDQDKTANLILDYSPGKIQVFKERGLLETAVTISRSRFDAFATFVKEGMIHILEGMDHVLFVLCLVLGATAFGKLLWRITGFTIGHSITLSAGFFGFVPSAAWFIPAVEIGIALSILYAALIAIVPMALRNRGEISVVIVTGLIGLLHGLGFSFVLKNILQVTSPDIWQSLIAFNVGVELGQIVVVITAWTAFLLMARLATRFWSIGRIAIGILCITVSVYWTIERAGSLVNAM
jgi:HupE/UreJ protein